jgi:hypothetical protein
MPLSRKYIPIMSVAAADSAQLGLQIKMEMIRIRPIIIKLEIIISQLSAISEPVG